jgi:hypothetical protein
LDTLLLKVTVTPLLLWTVTLISRRWGNLVGGLFAGLPVTSGPISIYLALDEGPKFAEHAASGSLKGLGAVAVSYLIYSFLLRHVGVLWCCVITLVVYMLFSIILIYFDKMYLSILCNIFISAFFMLKTVEHPEKREIKLYKPRWSMMAKVGSSITLVLMVTTFAHYFGPTVSGFLAPIPFIVWPLIVFAHMQGERAATYLTIRGAAVAMPGVIAFNCTIITIIDRSSLSATYTIASFAALVISFCVVLAVNRTDHYSKLAVER